MDSTMSSRRARLEFGPSATAVKSLAGGNYIFHLEAMAYVVCGLVPLSTITEKLIASVTGQ